MSNPPTDPEDPVGRLHADGFDVLLREGHLLIRGVPYLSSDGLHLDGQLVLPVNDSSSPIADVIGDHTIWFAGSEPHAEMGSIGSPNQRDIGGGEHVDYMLSFKPTETGVYADLYEKVRTYARILVGAARTADPTVTATNGGAAVADADDDPPLRYRDTNTSRAGLTDLSRLFRGQVVAIIGVGGTGSYILDQVAKTWVERIILIDGDELEIHNAFRAPGAADLSDLGAGRNKAEYFAEQYSNMHAAIEAHPVALTPGNLHLVADATYVFLAAADAADRPQIMAWLRDRGIPFVDVGMGISRADSGLSGLLRVSQYLPGDSVELPTEPATAPGADEYATNIQIADLNALNALLAVIQWKRWLGFYARCGDAREIMYKLFTNSIRNGVEE